MKIEVKIISKDNYKINDGIGWSLPVSIDEFITNPNEIEFEWEDGSILPYNDFLFYGSDYYYSIFLDGNKVESQV